MDKDDKEHPPLQPAVDFNSFMFSMFSSAPASIQDHQQDMADQQNKTRLVCALIHANPALNEQTAVDLAASLLDRIKKP